ncbi:MAG: hypothetical protein CM1200mP38_1730 [Dehalococcoidia bacterium]|nr:MAG: hypothetical protein CM1200mP38_1730 [Dehalococcoidia bacterium]
MIKIRRVSDEIQLIHNDNFSPIESIFSYLRLDDDLRKYIKVLKMTISYQMRQGIFQECEFFDKIHGKQ